MERDSPSWAVAFNTELHGVSNPRIASEEPTGCCFVASDGEGCCCVGHNAEGCCCVPANHRGCCCCCVAPIEDEDAKNTSVIFAFAAGNVKNSRLRLVPSELLELGIEQERWTAWLDLIDEQLKAHYEFYDQPCYECCYWCCPFGPLQLCWCMANPHTHRMVARLGDASAVVEHVINKELHAVLSGAPEGSKAHSMRDAHFAWMGGVCVFHQKGASARPLLKLRTSALEGRAIPVDLPIELKEASVTQAEWACIAEELQAERRAHLCHRCPWLGPLYFCCPLGPFQWCTCILTLADCLSACMLIASLIACRCTCILTLAECLSACMLIASIIACRCACMLNPCTWYHGMRVFRARAACETAINRDLSAHGLYFKYGTDATAQFRRGVPHKTLGMRTKQKGISLNLIQIAGTASGIDLSRPLGALSARGALGAPEEAESTAVGSVKV